jgi:predicted regulator of amino acid metabolism with ACT domain
VPVDLNRLKILANYFEKTPSALLQEVDALAVKLVARGIEVVEEMPRETGVFEMVPKNIARLVAELRRN